MSCCVHIAISVAQYRSPKIAHTETTGSSVTWIFCDINAGWATWEIYQPQSHKPPSIHRWRWRAEASFGVAALYLIKPIKVCLATVTWQPLVRANERASDKHWIDRIWSWMSPSHFKRRHRRATTIATPPTHPLTPTWCLAHFSVRVESALLLWRFTNLSFKFNMYM